MKYLIEDGDDWVRITVGMAEDGSSGSCAACSHADGIDGRGAYMLDFWTDTCGAGDVLCPLCFQENTPTTETA